MPRFATLLAAFGLLSASAFAQSNLGSVEADLVARNDMSSDSLFARSGDLESRSWGKENFGHRCKHSSECRTDVHMSKAFCDHTRHCNFHCLGDTIKSTKHGYHCLGKYEAKKCRFNHSCKTNVEHAWGYCNSGKCTFACDKGYHAWDGKCVETKPALCHKHKCPEVEGGWSTCSKHGKCEQHCESHMGAKLYTNKHKTAYKCINIWNDKNNCGKPNHVCPGGYHHKGEAVCWEGKCTLNCHGYKVAHTHSGVAYCSSKKA